MKQFKKLQNNFLENLKMQDKLTWKPVKTSSDPSLRPSPRWGHCSCIVQDELVLFGGYANSIYMNDVWIFNTISMEWSEVKTTGSAPTFRSNCSFNYDHTNNRLVLFGGGSQNKKRYNDISLLDWSTKHWTTISFSENETAPWQRTYHSTELIYPYLITFGGEGLTDCDDLWVFNFETLKWKEVSFPQNAIRPCGRRFHTSCLIGTEYFVIGGCYSKYKPLNDIYSIDLTKLIQTGSVEGLQWKQRLNHHGFLTRWGQSLAVQGKNIYLFGGRFINDLNDLIVFNTENNKMQVLEVAADTIPKPRRRSSLNFVGNCLLMFGGFNTEYYNDLHYINIGQMKPKIKKGLQPLENQTRAKLENFTDLPIISRSGTLFNCHTGIFRQYFNSQHQLQHFLNWINGEQQDSDLIQMIDEIYQGYGDGKLLIKYLIEIPESQGQKQSLFIKMIEGLKPQKQQPATGSLTCPTQKNNVVFKLPRFEYSQYITKHVQTQYKDIKINFVNQKNNNRFSLKSNKIVLMRNSQYFSNLLRRIQAQQNALEIRIPFGKVEEMEILLACLITGYLVIPEDLSTTQIISLYAVADYFSFNDIKNIIRHHITTIVAEATVDEIFEFAEQYNLEDLAINCAHFAQSKACSSKISEQNRYYQISYGFNKFQIIQEGMTKTPSFVCKRKNSTTESSEQDKENVEVCRC